MRRACRLNPNLVYGNGSVAGLTSSGQASTNQGLKVVPFNSGINDAVNSYMQSKQVDQSVSESKTRQLLLAQQVRESMSRENRNWLEGAFDRDTYNTRKHQLERQNTMIEKLLDKYSQDIEESGSRVAINKKKLDEMQANIELLQERKNLTYNQALTELCKPALIRSQVRRNSKLNELSDKQIEYYGELILIGHAEWVRKDLQNYIDFEREGSPYRNGPHRIDYNESDDVFNELLDAVCDAAKIAIKTL